MFISVFICLLYLSVKPKLLIILRDVTSVPLPGEPTDTFLFVGMFTPEIRAKITSKLLFLQTAEFADYSRQIITVN